MAPCPEKNIKELSRANSPSTHEQSLWSLNRTQWFYLKNFFKSHFHQSFTPYGSPWEASPCSFSCFDAQGDMYTCCSEYNPKPVNSWRLVVSSDPDPLCSHRKKITILVCAFVTLWGTMKINEPLQSSLETEIIGHVLSIINELYKYHF